ncbi:PPOX class F420-dependent oxidoreductase [Flexivirga meconopsidis]|uniref:PPOX class F420-dependent oxidoreductase n=1 Tax=Flexivirga meconopsidis TaxID=2977121 RepID=UPI00223FE24B|nr:PPOX class F420-dependent oxidoreductase [Flexivirga meconopsidis]
MTIFTPAERDYLRSHPLGRLATLQPSGTLQNNPVGFQLNDDDTIDVFGRAMAQSQKYQNVASHDRVAFVVDDLAATDPWTPRCLEIRGRAGHIRGEAAFGGDGHGIRIHPSRLLSFGINESGLTPTVRSVA